MKSICYQVLKVLSDYYPTWVLYLNKKDTPKKTILKPYCRILTEAWPQTIAGHLINWLNSFHNVDFQRWPPSPLELKGILEALLREKENAPPPGGDSSENDPELSLHRLGMLFFIGHPDLFNEKNKHLKPAVQKVADCLANNKPLYHSARRFAELFCELRKYQRAHVLFQRLLRVENRKELLTRIGQVNINAMMRFLWETNWNPEITEILDKYYKKPLL